MALDMVVLTDKQLLSLSQDSWSLQLPSIGSQKQKAELEKLKITLFFKILQRADNIMDL